MATFGTKESTQNEYRKKVLKLEKDGFPQESWRERASDILEHLKQYAVSTQKGYLSAIKFTLAKDDIPGLIQDRIDELYKIQNEKARSQVPTEKQNDFLIPWNKIVEEAAARIEENKKGLAYLYLGIKGRRDREAVARGTALPDSNAILDDVAKDEKMIEGEKMNVTGTGGGANSWSFFSDRMLVNALYTLQAPTRLDYANMKFVDDGVGNACILKTRTTSYFVFRKYKTDATYGEIRIDINPKLFDLIQLSLWNEDSGTDLLLSYKTSAVLGNVVREQFGFGVDILRHSYIMEHFPKLKTIVEKDELARRMLHSRNTQETYNLVGVSDEIKKVLESFD